MIQCGINIKYSSILQSSVAAPDLELVPVHQGLVHLPARPVHVIPCMLQ